MNQLQTILAVALGGACALTGHTNEPPAEPTAVLVGTFDSRALCVAYVQSEAFDGYLGAQMADVSRAIERAKAEGDRALAADLEALGPAMQKRLHERGFGSAPVDDLLAKLAHRLPEIAEEAGVELIVSEWQIAWRAEGAELVDVTDLLVAEFDPSDATLESVRQLRQHDPVPADQLDHAH